MDRTVTVIENNELQTWFLKQKTFKGILRNWSAVVPSLGEGAAETPELDLAQHDLLYEK